MSVVKKDHSLKISAEKYQHLSTWEINISPSFTEKIHSQKKKYEIYEIFLIAILKNLLH